MSEPSTSSRPSTSKSRGVCRFYGSQRGCLNGDACRFLHGEEESLTPYDKSKTCKFYAAGFCRRGDGCWFRHVEAEPIASSTSSERNIGSEDQDVCGICLEKPVTYGLLAGCSHVFCLQCLRDWRDTKGKSEEVIASGNIKKCPYCRSLSAFITPSSQFYPNSHSRKAEIIAQYKASMARVPCRYFQSSLAAPPKFCPYGRDCFYQHRLPDGTPYEFPHGTDYYMARQRRYNRLREQGGHNSASGLINHFRDFIVSAATGTDSEFGAVQRTQPALSSLITDIIHYAQAHSDMDGDLWSDIYVSEFMNFLMRRMRDGSADEQPSDSESQQEDPPTTSYSDMPSLEHFPSDWSPEGAFTNSPSNLDTHGTNTSQPADDASGSLSWGSAAAATTSWQSSPFTSTSSRFSTVLPRTDPSSLIFTIDSDEEESTDERANLRSTSSSPIGSASPRMVPASFGLRRSASWRQMSFGQIPFQQVNVTQSGSNVASSSRRSQLSPGTPAVVLSPDTEITVEVDNVLQEAEGTLRNLDKAERTLSESLPQRQEPDMEGRETSHELRPTSANADEAQVLHSPKIVPRRSRSQLAIPSLTGPDAINVTTGSNTQRTPYSPGGGFITDGRGRVIRSE